MRRILLLVTGDELARETAERKRKSLSELFFAGEWKTPIDTKIE